MSYIRKSYIYLLFLIFFEFLIINGRFIGSPIFRYISFVITFVVFFSCLFKIKNVFIFDDAKTWIPFFLWTIIGAFVLIEPGIMFMWATAFLVLLIATRSNIKEIFPYKFLLWFGVIQIIGQILQAEFPTIYHQIMSVFLKSDYREFGSGYQGFTTQTGMTAATLVYAFATYIYFYAPKKNVIINIVIIIIFLISIFYTGKRSFSFTAVLIPMIVFFFSTKNTSRLVKYGLPLAFVVLFFFSIILSNLEMFQNVRGLGKMVHGIEMFKDDEEDIDMNGREILWAAAIKGYQEKPLFGIGVSQFEDWSGLGTNAHNMYLQVLCEQGIIGIVCLLLPLLVCLSHTILILRRNKEGTPYVQSLKFSLFVQLFFIIYGLSGNPTRNTYGYMMYFIAIGLQQSFRYKGKTLLNITRKR